MVECIKTFYYTKQKFQILDILKSNEFSNAWLKRHNVDQVSFYLHFVKRDEKSYLTKSYIIADSI